jgi:hypothetical protein
MANAAAECLPEKIRNEKPLHRRSHAMSRDATEWSQIGPLRFAVGCYAVLGGLHLLAQGVHLNLITRHAAENRNEWEIKVEAQGCLVDQVDSAGQLNRCGKRSGWREANRLR